jgi:hypothetical protein
MPTPHGSRGGTVFGAEELRVLRRTRALALRPRSASAEDARDCPRPAVSVDGAADGGARPRAVLSADRTHRRTSARRSTLHGPEVRSGGTVIASSDDGVAGRTAGRTGRHARGGPRGTGLPGDRRGPVKREPEVVSRGGADREPPLLGREGTPAGPPPGGPGSGRAPRPGERPARQPAERPADRPERPGPAGEPGPVPAPAPPPGTPRPGRPVPTPGEVFPPKRRPAQRLVPGRSAPGREPPGPTATLEPWTTSPRSCPPS